jgi:type II secretory pathway pseudopilin PulG
MSRLEVAILLAIVAVGAAFVGSKWIKDRELQRRRRVRRVRMDLRSLATGIESYFIDNNEYPASSDRLTDNANGGAENGSALAGLPTFRADTGAEGPFSITTPVAYITAHFIDPFAPVKRASFCYWRAEGDVPGWIMWSPGQDGDYDLTMANIAAVYNPGETTPSAGLIERTFDPTNGTNSDGDMWRVKE